MRRIKSMLKPKICVYIHTDKYQAIKKLPKSVNISEKLREKIDEILEEYDLNGHK